jgi:hypothetical protein
MPLWRRTELSGKAPHQFNFDTCGVIALSHRPRGIFDHANTNPFILHMLERVSRVARQIGFPRTGIKD